MSTNPGPNHFNARARGDRYAQFRKSVDKTMRTSNGHRLLVIITGIAQITRASSTARMASLIQKPLVRDEEGGASV